MAAKKKRPTRAQLLARARFVAKFGKKKGRRKAAKKRKAPKRSKAKRRTGKKAAYLAHKGKLYQCLGPIRRGCGGGANVVVR
jgi:hypothetical protein